MLWIKRNLSLVAGGIAAVILLGLAGYYLYSGIQKNKELQGLLISSRDQFQALWNSEVFPDRENINAAKEEEKRLQALKTELSKYFQPVKPVKGLSALEFSRMTQRMVGELQDMAYDSNIYLPPDYAFTFTPAVTDLISDGKSIDPLAVQFAEVKAISEILFNAKIFSLDDIKRARIASDDEGPKASAGDYHDARIITNDFAVLMPYEVTFRTFSQGLADTLNGIKTSPYGVVVKSIVIKHEKKDLFNAGSGSSSELERIARMISEYDPQFIAQRFPGRRDPRSRPQPGFDRSSGARPPPPRLPSFTAPSSNPGAATKPNAPKTVLDEQPVTITMKLQFVRL